MPVTSKNGNEASGGLEPTRPLYGAAFFFCQPGHSNSPALRSLMILWARLVAMVCRPSAARWQPRPDGGVIMRAAVVSGLFYLPVGHFYGVEGRNVNADHTSTLMRRTPASGANGERHQVLASEPPGGGTTPRGRLRMRRGCLAANKYRKIGAGRSGTRWPPGTTSCTGQSHARQQRYGSPPEDAITAG